MTELAAALWLAARLVCVAWAIGYGAYLVDRWIWGEE